MESPGAKPLTASAVSEATACVLHLRGGARGGRIEGVLRNVMADGAEAVVATVLPVGASVDVEASGHRHAATVKSSRPHTGGKWLATLKLSSGSWSYDMFRKATEAAANPAAPPCLRDLGLEIGATAAEIEAAYFARARSVHPDRGGDAEAFARLHACYLAALKIVGGRR